MEERGSDTSSDDGTIKTSFDYTDEAFSLLSEASSSNRALSHSEITRFARLIIKGVQLEPDNGLREGSFYLEKELPNGKAMLEEAKATGNYVALTELIVKHETALSKHHFGPK